MSLASTYRSLDCPGKIEFTGSETAELFTREIQESLEGVLENNTYYDKENLGFVSASIDGRPWDGTMWTRDAGVWIRELVHWGYLGTACICSDRLIELCGQNEEGYFAFPERFDVGVKGFGYEIDGTASILIAFALLVERLNLLEDQAAKETKEKILSFVCQTGSPLRFIIHSAEEKGLVKGTGEFGGGMFVEEAFCNVVQNMLAANALKLWQGLLESLGLEELSGLCKKTQEKMEATIRARLTGKDGFLWCVDPETLLPPDGVLSAETNVGFSGINGAGAMISDVYTPEEIKNWWGLAYARQTFRNLCDRPIRKVQYEKYGMYLQFEKYCQGLLTSPSYGMGYAIQLALITGEAESAGKMLDYLAQQTCRPPKDYVLHRRSPYWFYERMLSPDYFELPTEEQTIEEGCGALNLVNVAEPLKIARLLAGVGTVDSTGNLFPYRADGITGVKLTNWTVLTPSGLQRRSFERKLGR